MIKKLLLWIKQHRKFSFIVFGGGGVLLVLALVLLLVSELVIASACEGRLADDATQLSIPHQLPVLVLGCAPQINGRNNSYFTNRMSAAAELWRAGKASVFVVSGDNRRKAYNEPEWMKEALVKLGVPAERVVCDYAGLRTLDSIVRMKEIFGMESYIIVSQKFHNERALAIAAKHGHDAYALNADVRAGRAALLRNWLRERAARVWMLIDLYVRDRQPRHLGEPIRVG
ncbi:MAG: ElyC/SanA/YdcF family protein [Akkermansia sp.]|nr:ElyC/SanA/YdcF family protein [Akkermansia sp.]